MQQDHDGLYGAPCWWRVTSQQARMGPLDARLLLALALLVLWPSWLTLVLGIAAVFFFAATTSINVRPESALRAARALLAGPLRPAGFRPPRAMLSMAWEDTPGALSGPRPPKPPRSKAPAPGPAKGWRKRLVTMFRVFRRRPRSAGPAEAPPASNRADRR